MNLFTESIQLKRLPDFNSVSKLLRNNVKLYSRTQALEWVLHEGRWRNPKAWRSLFHHRSADAMLTGLINVCVLGKPWISWGVTLTFHRFIHHLHHAVNLLDLDRGGAKKRKVIEKKKKRTGEHIHLFITETQSLCWTCCHLKTRLSEPKLTAATLHFLVTLDHSAGFTLNVSIFFSRITLQAFCGRGLENMIIVLSWTDFSLPIDTKKLRCRV